MAWPPPGGRRPGGGQAPPPEGPLLGSALGEAFEIPVYEFEALDEGAAPDFDLDDLPPDLQALLARDCTSSCTAGSNATGSLSIPSDLQSLMMRSRGASSQGSCHAPQAAHGYGRTVEPDAELRIDFDVLRRSNTLAAGLPLAMQRSARKIEREARAVARLNSTSGSAPTSLQASLTASGRIASLAARAAACGAGLLAAASGRRPSAAWQDSLAPPGPSDDDEIETILQHTIQDDDVEQFLRPPSCATGRSRSRATSYTLHPPRGLANLGNTCFVNAAIQALGHCTPLTAYLLQGLFVMDLNEANPLGTGCVLTMVFAALLHDLFALRPASSASSSGMLPAASAASSASGPLGPAAVPPLDFLVAVAQFHPFLATGEMHDAQELLAWLLDALNEDLNRAPRRATAPVVGLGPVVAAEVLSAREEERHAAAAWCEHLRCNRSVIVDLFQGQLRSQLRCPECGVRSLTFDPFLHLTLPLPANTDVLRLEDALELLCREEALDCDNLWECPGCGRRVLARKKLDLWKLPPLLMVHLKRFEWAGLGPEAAAGGPAACGVRKLGCLVELPPERLDLKPLVAPEAPQKEPLRYDLIAVVDHLGNEAEEGHYTATCRRPDGWWHFDDSRASPLAPGAAVVGRQNYVLFLERRSAPTEPRAIAEQRASEPHAWPHLIDVDWSFLTGSACDG